MTESMVPFFWQLAGGFITLITIILTLYIFLLNPRRQVNRLVGLATGLFAMSSIGAMLAIRANTYAEGAPALAILAAAIPATGPALILATIGILKPKWLKGRMAWLWFIAMIITLIPIFLTAYDMLSGRGIYLATLDLLDYSGGYLRPDYIVHGIIGQVIIQADLIFYKLILLGLLIYLSFLDKSLIGETRTVVRILLVILAVSWLFEIFLEGILPDGIAKLISGALITIGYVFTAYRQMVITHSLLSGRVQIRLTTLIAAITIPLLVFVAWFLLGQAGTIFEEKSREVIDQQTNMVSNSIDQMINGDILAMQNLARQPGIVSMDPSRQQPLLETMAALYPSMEQIAVLDLSGMTLAQSDGGNLGVYNDQTWFQEILRGDEYALETIIGDTRGQPAIVGAVPVLGSDGQMIGACMFTSLISEIREQVLSWMIGETGIVYVVDEQDHLLVHPDILPSSGGFIDFSTAVPVAALREDKTSPVVFRDEGGKEWLAGHRSTKDGWGVVVQQELPELLGAVGNLQRTTLGIALVGSVLMLALAAVTIRQTIRPIDSLTETVKEVALGDLSRAAPVVSEDEFGTLAQAFNSMTLQIRNLVEGLERRVAERTLDLEHRSAQLQAAAEVGRASADIRNLDELLPLVARLISERFGFYHVGIFLLDDNQEYAVLRAANSEGGLAMLQRNHKLLIGQQGIVGYVSQQREPRIALNVGEDAVYFSNPDLPQTQSEIALPLMVRQEMLGVLDVQSKEQSAFTEQDVRTLQVLADQVAIAIHSARLVQQLEQVLETERQMFGEISNQAWREQVRGLVNKGLSRTEGGVIPIREIKDSEVRQAIRSGELRVSKDDLAVLYVPVKVRGIVIGVLKLTRSEKGKTWMNEDLELTEKLAEQLGVALESARAYQTTQIRAQKDRVLAEISSKIRETMDVDMILRVASQEVRKALGVPKVVIQLGRPEKIDQLQHSQEPLSEHDGDAPKMQSPGEDDGSSNQGGDHE